MKDPARERRETLEILAGATDLLTRSLDARLIPLTGLMLGYAIRGARDKNGIAAVKGGIITENEKPRGAGPCDFGVDDDIARIILTVMKFDPGIRSAATLRCSRNLLRSMESLFLECTPIKADRGPAGLSTMDWSVASCCKEGVPDGCYPYAGKGDEPLVVLFGGDPIDVTNNIIMISNRIISIEL
jgi:predicted fused transcriptional regulator/phosphomethylpyrimidine kinase